MAMGTKATVDTIGSAAMMGVMAIPGAGPFLAGALAGGMALFDIFYQEHESTGPALVTTVDLQNAVNELKLAIKDSEIDTQMEANYSELSTLNNSLSHHWAELHKIGLDDFSEKWDLNDSTNPMVQKIIAMEKPLIEEDSGLKKAMDFFEAHPKWQIKYISIYLYAVNTFVLYCKLNLIWEYRKALHSDKYPELTKFAAETFNKKDPALIKGVKAWMKNGKKGPNPIDKAKEDFLKKQQNKVDAAKLEFKKDSFFIQTLVDYLGEDDDKSDRTDKKGKKLKNCIDLLTDFVDMVEECYSKYGKRMKSREASIVVNHTAHGYEVYDNETKRAIKTYPVKKLAEIHAKSYFATIAPSIYTEEILDKHVEDLAPTDRDKLRQIRDHWKLCRVNAVDFLDHYKSNTNKKD